MITWFTSQFTQIRKLRRKEMKYQVAMVHLIREFGGNILAAEIMKGSIEKEPQR